MAITTHDRRTPVHWDYFLYLEDDLLKLARYVELSKKNYSSFSLELAHLLLTSCSEVDATLKQICKQKSPDESPGNIVEYQTILERHCPLLKETKVEIPRYGLNLTPWKNWQGTAPESPNWWKDHNKVKHQRHEEFEKAHLSNVLNAMAGLFSTLFFLYENEGEQGWLSPSPQLFKIGTPIEISSHEDWEYGTEKIVYKVVPEQN